MSVPFSPQGSGVLWFMYALTALYLVAPVISPWLCSASRRSVEIYLALWGITLCLPLIKDYVTIAQGVGSPLYYVSGYVGYFLLGYYMHRWPGSLRWRVLLPLLVVSLGAPVMCKLAGWQVDFYEVFWYLSIFVAVMCAVWFKVMRTLFDKRFVAGRRFPVLVLVSSLSFGIYLFHIFLLRDVLWHVPLLDYIDNYMLHTFTVAVLTIIGSIAVTYVISLLPIGAYVVGCRNYISSCIKPEKCN